MNHKKIYTPNIFAPRGKYEKKKLTLRERNQKFDLELNNIAPRGGNFYKHHPSATKE